jgi:peptidoglycan/xylan/chitin deacetylase (PgdA/CDA1 family)
MLYMVHTPWWLEKLYPDCTWKLPANEKIIYLTFDDGPHPIVTPAVLSILEQFNAKATFFCIGKNSIAHPNIYQQTIDLGHAVGNHSFSHVNGWKTPTEVYLADIAMAAKSIKSKLFRPPYGRITRFQLKQIKKQPFALKPIMWSVLSGDFDPECSKEKCANNVLTNAKSGSIVVFHDSEKAQKKMLYALPLVLAHFSSEGYRFECLPT